MVDENHRVLYILSLLQLLSLFRVVTLTYRFGPPFTERSNVYEHDLILNDLLRMYRTGANAATGADTWEATDV